MGRPTVEPRAWLILGLGIWTLTSQVATAVARGGWGGPLRPPSEQDFEFSSPFLWPGRMPALLALASRGPWRWPRPSLWVFWSVVLLGWHSVTYSWPTLRKKIQEAPLADTRLRQALSGDWRAVLEQAERVTERGLRHDDGFLYEPENRHAIPPSVLNTLVHSPEVLRISPPALRGRGSPSLTARFLQGLAEAWPSGLPQPWARSPGLGARRDPEAACLDLPELDGRT